MIFFQNLFYFIILFHIFLFFNKQKEMKILLVVLAISWLVASDQTVTYSVWYGDSCSGTPSIVTTKTCGACQASKSGSYECSIGLNSVSFKEYTGSSKNCPQRCFE